MSEADLQKAITDLCDWHRLRWHHEVDSRKSKAGFPDLTIVGARLVFAELKAERGRVSAEQQAWIDDLRAAGVEVYVWRPSDMPEIIRVIKSLHGGA